ncbi:MAG: NADH-quinone oxidoreductase subunit N [Verrucomicrobia bacterium]|nr:NADH-quinone oxidoreductase subunit N [Verrucomicrobiota bacterium]
MFPSISLEILILALGFILLLAESFSSSTNKRSLAHIAIFCLGWIFAFSFFVQSPPPVVAQGSYWNFYAVDGVSMVFKRIALLTTIGVLVLALDYESTLAKLLPSAHKGAGTGEFYILPLFTCAGLMLMASAVDFVMAFTALELVTISFYVLVAYARRSHASLEAGVKYLILGALSTGFIVYGITWIFGLTGETHFSKVAEKLAHLDGSDAAITFTFLLLLAGLGFKIAAVPFQSWVPDVYEGAPTPVTAFLSVGSKAAGFLLFLRVLEPFLGVQSTLPRFLQVLALVAGATLIFGNLAALPQLSLKRLLAYSSIGHAGYLISAVACVGAQGNLLGGIGITVGYYLFAYMLMTLLAFAVLTLVSVHSKGEDIQHFNGLSKRSPFLAFSMLVAMSSLAGVPLTAGFYGKFLVFAQIVQAHQWVLLALGFITAGAGFYYYFRVVAAMFWNDPVETAPISVSPLSKAAIGLLVACIFIFGINPKPVLSALRASAPSVASAAH